MSVSDKNDGARPPKDLPEGRNGPTVASYDEAFNRAGFGLWQYLLLLQCGWANVSDAIEIMCISFFLPAIRDTMNVSHAALSALTFALFFGMLIGGYFWGSLADIYGRRKTIYVSLTVNALFGGLSAACTSYWLLLLFRFISGFGAGGSVPVCFTYFSEFQPTKYRGGMISALATCWMVGNIIVGLLAWAILPHSDVIVKISPFGQQWRFFAILCAIPSLTSAMLFFIMPESPKFLYIDDRPIESLKVLKTMHAWNNFKKHVPPFSIVRLIPHEGYNSAEDTDDGETSNLLPSSINNNPSSHLSRPKGRVQKKSLLRNLQIWKSQMSQIYAPFRRCNSVYLTVIIVIIAFCGYGMGMWTPVLMEKTEKHNGSPCHGHARNKTLKVSSSNNSAQMYVDVLIGFVAQLPGNILTILLMDRVGAKVMLVFGMYTSGTSVLFFWLAEAKSHVIIMNGIYNALMSCVWNSFDVIMVETYPTNIRSAASGHLTGISRIGSILGTVVFALFMDLDCSVPILTVFVLFVLTGTLSLKLPNTRNIILD